jgi:hypothetical protein
MMADIPRSTQAEATRGHLAKFTSLFIYSFIIHVFELPNYCLIYKTYSRKAAFTYLMGRVIYLVSLAS